MKYREFKEKIKDWGRKYNYETEVEIDFNYVDVKIKSGVAFQMIAKIRTDLELILDTNWKSFADIKEDVMKALTRKEKTQTSLIDAVKAKLEVNR